MNPWLALIPMVAVGAGCAGGRWGVPARIESASSPGATAVAGSPASSPSGDRNRPASAGVLSTRVAVAGEKPAVDLPSLGGSESDLIVREILPQLSEDQFARVVRGAVQRNPECWSLVLDLFLSSEDASFIAYAGELLSGGLDPKSKDRIGLAFKVEKNAERRRLLAGIMGGIEGSAPVAEQVERILDGDDSEMIDLVLDRLSLHVQPEDRREGIATRLRILAGSSPSRGTRARVLRILSAEGSAQNYRFLLDRILKDPDDAVQVAALDLLKVQSPDVSIRNETVRILYSILIGPGRSEEIRRSAARHLRYLIKAEPDLGLSAEQEEIIQQAAKDPEE